MPPNERQPEQPPEWFAQFANQQQQILQHLAQRQQRTEEVIRQATQPQAPPQPKAPPPPSPTDLQSLNQQFLETFVQNPLRPFGETLAQAEKRAREIVSEELGQQRAIEAQNQESLVQEARIMQANPDLVGFEGQLGWAISAARMQYPQGTPDDWIQAGINATRNQIARVHADGAELSKRALVAQMRGQRAGGGAVGIPPEGQPPPEVLSQQEVNVRMIQEARERREKQLARNWPAADRVIQQKRTG